MAFYTATMRRLSIIPSLVFTVVGCGGGSGEGVTIPPPPSNPPPVPTSAAIIYHRDGFVFVMNADGTNPLQITFTIPRAWEHVALSPDRRFVVGNVQGANPTGIPGGLSQLWLVDLTTGSETQLLPSFESVGNGGVAWDDNDRIYFACRIRSPFASPQTPQEFQANAGSNDVCSVRADGSDVRTLIVSPDQGEADVSNAEDGTLLTYVVQPVTEDVTEIWIAETDGSNPRRIFRAGKTGVASAHDPEFSPDNQRVIFSMVNSQVPPNFPAEPNANTAHDIYSIRVDGSDLRRLSMPGPISIIPDWKNNTIIYTDIGDFTGYIGASSVDPSKIDQSPVHLQAGATSPRWIR